MSFVRSYAAFSSPVTVDVLLRFSFTLMNSGAWSSSFSCSFSSCNKEESPLSVSATGQKCISYIKSLSSLLLGVQILLPRIE